MHYKRDSKVFAFILILIMGLLFVSCSPGREKGGSTAIVGTWEMVQITAGSSQVNAEDYMKSANVNQVPVLSFEEDGTVTLKTDSSSGSGTWLEQNGQYTITYQSSDREDVTKKVDLSNDTLTMEQNGYILTYERK